MISDLIKDIIDKFIITKYEESLITKYKYNFKMSDYELLKLNLTYNKIKLLNKINSRCKND